MERTFRARPLPCRREERWDSYFPILLSSCPDQSSNFSQFVGVAGEIPAGAVAEVRKQGINTLIGLRLPGFILYLSGLYVDDIKGVHLHLSELRAAAGNLIADGEIIADIGQRQQS